MIRSAVLAVLLMGTVSVVYAADFSAGQDPAQRSGLVDTVLQGTPPGEADRRQNVRPAACCKICRKGKACGDSCIKRTYTCTRPPGCACNG